MDLNRRAFLGVLAGGLAARRKIAAAVSPAPNPYAKLFSPGAEIDDRYLRGVVFHPASFYFRFDPIPSEQWKRITLTDEGVRGEIDIAVSLGVLPSRPDQASLAG